MHDDRGLDGSTAARGRDGAERWARVMLRDVQFWIPLTVLAGGLLVLAWVR